MVYRSSHFDRETGIEQRKEEKELQLIDVIFIWMLDLMKIHYTVHTFVSSLDDTQIMSTTINKNMPNKSLYVLLIIFT